MNPKLLRVTEGSETELENLKSGAQNSTSALKRTIDNREPLSRKTSRTDEVEQKKPKRQEAPPKSLEELFNKTKALPSIYWKMAVKKD